MPLQFDGKSYWPTGSYSRTFVVNDQSASLPEFNVGVMIGRNLYGPGYNINDGVTEASLKKPVFYGYSQAHLVKEQFGDDSDLATAFEFAKRHGLTACFVAGITPATQGEATLQDSVPADTLTLKVNRYGNISQGYFFKIEAGDVSGKKVTIIPPKNIHHLSAAYTAAATSCRVKSIGSLKVGDSIYLASDTLTPAFASPPVITAIIENKSGELTVDYTIETDVQLSASAGVLAETPFIFQADAARAIVSGDLTTKYEFLAFNDEQSHIEFVDDYPANANLPDNIAEVGLSGFPAQTPGTSPMPTTTDWAALLDALPAYMTEFASANKVELRVFNFLTGDHATHTAIRDFAIARRSANKPIDAILGTAGGVIDPEGASTATNPALQAAALNHDNVTLCVGGGDGHPGYLSFAPAVFGIVIGSALAHNLTNDLVRFAVPEVIWDEDGKGEVTKLLRSSCLIYAADPFRGLHIEKGVNTYQFNTETWNAIERSTYLRMQRTLADYVSYSLRRTSLAIGTTDVEYTVADVKARKFAVMLALQKNSIVKSVGKIDVVPDAGNEGFQVAVQGIQLPRENNYELIDLYILV